MSENPRPVWVFNNLLCLSCLCLPFFLPDIVSSPHLAEFARADPIRHNLPISAPLCWNLLFSHLTFLKKHAALALSGCASHTTLTGLASMHGLQRVARLCFLFLSTSSHTQSLDVFKPKSSAFFFLFFSPKVLCFYLRLWLTSTSATLGRRCKAMHQLLSSFIWKQTQARTLGVTSQLLH